MTAAEKAALRVVAQIRRYPNVHEYPPAAEQALLELERMYCEATARQTWIPVSERLPHDPASDEYQHLPQYAVVVIRPITGRRILSQVKYIGHGNWLTFAGYRVTHWLPLPPEPASEETP